MADRQRLEKLLAFHERAADAVRLTLSLLNGDERATKAATANGTIAAALKLDAGRRATKHPTRKYYGNKVTGHRQQSARLLQSFSVDEPRRSTVGHKIAGLIRHGYVKSAGRDDAGRALYLRTAKTFVV
jgi:hypothetical protein